MHAIEPASSPRGAPRVALPMLWRDAALAPRLPPMENYYYISDGLRVSENSPGDRAGWLG